MKRLLVLTVALVAATGVTLAGVDGSSHDLGTLDTGKTRVCIFCHTPHNATQAVPLWNHTLSGASYTAYTSVTMNAYSGAAGDWDGGNGSISALCMSCHDGTLTRGDVVNDLNGTVGAGTKLTGSALLSTDLTDDHPVSFDYSLAIDNGDTELYANPTAQNGNVLLFGTDGNVECASCHDPHDDTNLPFLVDTNNNSNICFACHNK